jgi:CHASE2 domain-containing sensor protein
MSKSARHARPLSRVAKAAVALEMLLSIGALGGGLVLVIAPRGEIMPLPLSALAGSPFDTYLVPGLILFGVLGLGPLVAARLAWVRHPLAPTAALVVGVGLLIWVAVEVAIIGYSNEPPLQAIYGILGVAIVLVAGRWLLGVGPPRFDEMRPRRSDYRRTSS